MKSPLTRSWPQSFFGAVIVLLLLSCNGESPTAPLAPPTPSPSPGAGSLGVVVGYVYSTSGGCLTGAVVEVLDGPRAGAKAIHTDHCQGPWDYEDAYGYRFQDLPVGKVRMRASKEGYQSQEKTFNATNGWFTRSDFVLAPE